MPSVLALLDFANKWVEKGGLVVLAIIVFAESGLLIGFFLPGDSLLFFAGFLASEAGGETLPGGLPAVAITASLAAIIGDQVGYAIGHRFGPTVFDKPKSRFFNPEYVVKAEVFFEKYGPKTIVLARFVPIVRTFVPTVAGAGKMHYRTFLTYNILGGVLWGGGITTLGFFLGEIDAVKNNIEIAAAVIVGVSILPIAIELWRHRKAAKAAKAAAAAASSSD